MESTFIIPKTKSFLYLLGDIECSAVRVWMAPVAAKNLAKYSIVRFLEALQYRENITYLQLMTFSNKSIAVSCSIKSIQWTAFNQ